MKTARLRLDAASRGDEVIVSAGELIPADGEIIRGVATINESAVTGESAPVLREAGTDRSGVIGGTKVLSDEIVVQVSAEPGGSFLDRMIALVEGANRQKTPNEIALTMLLAAMTLTFLIVVATLPSLGRLRRRQARSAAADRAAGVPDPDHDRRPAAGDRHRRHEPRAVGERAGQVRQGGRDRRRRRRAAARQDRHDHATATARRPRSIRWPASTWPRCAMPRCCPRWPTRRRKASRSSSSRASSTAWSPSPSGPTTCSSPRRRACPASTSRASRSAAPRDPQGRRRRDRPARAGAGRPGGAGAGRAHRAGRARRRHAAGGGRRPPRAGRGRAVRRGQARRQGALRAAARDGRAHRDDHRRQPADRRRHRRRSRRRRLHRRGHARRTSSRASAPSRPAAG